MPGLELNLVLRVAIQSEPKLLSTGAFELEIAPFRSSRRTLTRDPASARFIQGFAGWAPARRPILRRTMIRTNPLSLSLLLLALAKSES